VAVSEVEFDLLLDAVQAVIAPVAGEDFMLASLPIFKAPAPQFNARNAANDNQLAWPLIPFPQGWNAAC
jgi:hypothetical protein